MDLIYDQGTRIYWFEDGRLTSAYTGEEVDKEFLNPFDLTRIATIDDFNELNMKPIFVVTENSWYIIKGYRNQGLNFEDLLILSRDDPTNEEIIYINDFDIDIEYKKDNSYIYDKFISLSSRKLTILNY